MNNLFANSSRSRWTLPAITASFLALAAVLFTIQGIARKRGADGNGRSFVAIGGFFASNNVVIADPPRPEPEKSKPVSGVGHALDEPTDKAVRKLLDDQVAAWNQGDLKGFMAGYWNSPELSFYSGNNRTKGWQETYDRYRKRYQDEGKEMGKLTFSELIFDGVGSETVVVRGRWRLQLKADNPEGLFTLIVRKLPEGWRVVHDHTSVADPVPAKKRGNE